MDPHYKTLREIPACHGRMMPRMGALVIHFFLKILSGMANSVDPDQTAV